MLTPFKFTVTSLILAHNLNSDRVAKSQGHEARHWRQNTCSGYKMIAGDPHYHDMIASGMCLLYWFEISTRLKPEDSALLLCYSNRVLDVRRFLRNIEHQLPYIGLFFWVLTLNIWVSNCRRFEWTHCLHLQASKSPWRWYFLAKHRASITVYRPVLLGSYFKYLG